MAGLMTTILAPMWHYAALRVSIKLARLGLAMHKAGYDPNQPRAPAGSSIGGQWVSAGGRSTNTGSARVAKPIRAAHNTPVPPFDDPGLYYVDLADEDRKGRSLRHA